LLLCVVGGEAAQASHCAEAVSAAAGACAAGETFAVVFFADDGAVCVVHSLVAGWVNLEVG
jgi:hypothetical protein